MLGLGRLTDAVAPLWADHRPPSPSDAAALRAVALALAMLGLQTALALLGGLVLLVHMAAGAWPRANPCGVDGANETRPAGSGPSAAAVGGGEGSVRHAA